MSGLERARRPRRTHLGGLRIGKPLPERRADEPLDERLEWDRDGQYFHYLTQWMHALDQASRGRPASRASTSGRASWPRWPSPRSRLTPGAGPGAWCGR